jgi:hypothetical protein
MTEIPRTSGKWSRVGIPHKGWICVGVEDLEDSLEICEMCETQEIRYVHFMEHPDYPERLGCGCVCAGRMEENYEGARHRETILRNASMRKRRWLTRDWRISAKGNLFLNTDGYNIVVFLKMIKNGKKIWGFRITNRESNDSIQSQKPYPSEDSAKLRAFDAMIWMKEQGR